MKKKLIIKSFKLASDILKDIKKDTNKSQYSGFCTYKGICTKDNCKGCKYYKIKKD